MGSSSPTLGVKIQNVWNHHLDMFAEDIVNSVYLECINNLCSIGWGGQPSMNIIWCNGHVDSECYFVFLCELYMYIFLYVYVCIACIAYNFSITSIIVEAWKGAKIKYSIIIILKVNKKVQLPKQIT